LWLQDLSMLLKKSLSNPNVFMEGIGSLPDIGKRPTNTSMTHRGRLLAVIESEYAVAGA
jgi:hypothetical protein